MTKALAEVQSKSYIEKNDITLSKIIDLLLDESLKANKIKETTYIRNLQTKKIIEKSFIANLPIQQINRNQINQALSSLTNYANSTIEKTRILIRQAFNYAMLNEYINKDPFTIKGAVLKPVSQKKDKEVIALEIDEQKSLLQELEKRIWQIYRHNLYCFVHWYANWWNSCIKY